MRRSPSANFRLLRRLAPLVLLVPLALLAPISAPVQAATVVSGGAGNDYESWIERLHDGRLLVILDRNPDWASGDLAKREVSASQARCSSARSRA